MINEFVGDYKFLSNFYPAKVCLDGITYISVEHAYQAAKTFINKERVPFHQKPYITAGQAKRLGKNLILRPDWDIVKFAIMEDLVRQKFSIDPLRQQLANSGTHTLVEGNTWHDNYWGICTCTQCFGNMEAKNNLGHILMKVRNENASKGS